MDLVGLGWVGVFLPKFQPKLAILNRTQHICWVGQGNLIQEL